MEAIMIGYYTEGKNKLFLYYKETSSGGGIVAGQENNSFPDHNDEYLEQEYIALYKGTQEEEIYPCELINTNLKISIGDIVYLVIARYKTGDTFGNSFGHAAVMDVCIDVESAKEVAKTIEESAKAKKGWRAWQYPPWGGYFDRLEDVEIHRFAVQRYTDISDSCEPKIKIINHD